MKPDLTIDDLITALAERLQYTACHEDLKAYYDQRADLLCKVFGCDLARRGAELDEQVRENRRTSSQLRMLDRSEDSSNARYEVSGRYTLSFLNECLKLINAYLMPGGIWLEGRPPRIQQDLLEKYHDAIRDRERELKDIYRAIARDLLEYLFPGIGKWTVPSDKLFEMGLPREKPDVDDYF